MKCCTMLSPPGLCFQELIYIDLYKSLSVQDINKCSCQVLVSAIRRLEKTTSLVTEQMAFFLCTDLLFELLQL